MRRTRITGGVKGAGAETPSGFTLVELLVVVAILGALAALVAPVLAAARGAARAAACLSNLRQTGAAWLLYAGDADGTAPPSYRYGRDFRVETAWDFAFDWAERRVLGPGFVGAYLRDGRIHNCPDFEGEAWGRPHSGYAYNATYVGGDELAGLPPAPLGAVADPSRTAVFADAGFGSPVRGLNYLRAPSDPLFAAGTAHFRHRGGAHVAWADGRASRVGHIALPSPLNPLTGALSPDDSAYDLD